MIRCGLGRGKMILFGEHSAVWGHPAVGMPLPYRLQLEWSEGETGELPQGWFSLPQNDRPTFNELLLQLPDEFSRLQEGKWRYCGEVPRSGGFGSSAALCTALARIAVRYSGEDYNAEVHRLANRLECCFHTTPSGIDTGMASDTSSAIWYPVRGDIPRREPLPIPLCHFIYGAVKRRQTTAASIGTIRGRMISGESRTHSLIEKLGDIAREFILLCNSANIPIADTGSFARGTGILADQAQIQLAGLGLSTPELDQIIRGAKVKGALGGKMSGGGAGGAFWLVFPDADSRDRYHSAFKSKKISGAVFIKPLTTGV